MPAPTTAEDFHELVRKSGVVEEARIASFNETIARSGQAPADPAALAALMVRDGVLTKYQSEQLLLGRWKRFHVGKYKVLERIGSGGMGQVFLCEHRMMRRKVAVKILPAAKAADPAALERFYREARAVAALDHPNIVRAFDIDDDNGLHFIVMEYVDGTSLQDLVKKAGPLDPTRAAHYAYGTAVGLQHAHEMGLVHRDIKPGNILVDRQGVVKILDMGLARFFNDTDDILTKKYDDNVLGTADYLAPEQAFDSHTADIRADIYALGGTMYYMLTGQPPFAEGTVSQKILWHQTREPAPLLSLRPDCPPELAEVVRRMLVKEPEKRYQTPAEVMVALAGWVQSRIAPPAEGELPHLSRAALVAGPASRSSVGPASGTYSISASAAMRSDPLRPKSANTSASATAMHSPGPAPAPTPPPSETVPFRPPVLPLPPEYKPEGSSVPAPEPVAATQVVEVKPVDRASVPTSFRTTELWVPQVPPGESHTGSFASRLLALLGVLAVLGLLALAGYLALGVRP